MLCQFLREGTSGHSLRATAGKASGSIRLGNSTLILDSYSVRAKRGGELTGPNPTDRGKKGTKCYIAVTGDGVPIACMAAADVDDTVLFKRLLMAAFAAIARIRVGSTALADGTQQRLGAKERASCIALRPVRLHRSGPTSNRMHTLGCRLVAG